MKLIFLSSCCGEMKLWLEAAKRRNEQVRLRELAEAKTILWMLKDLQQHWEFTAGEMKRITHGNEYDLHKSIPHDLECSIVYWSARVHMLKTPEEVNDERAR